MESLKFRIWLLALAVAVWGLTPSHAFAQKRVAMVIGNNAYAAPLALNNPIADAQLVARMLKEDLGFEVIVRTNLGRADLHDAARELKEKAMNADVVVIYYSGHGVQGDGGNYLVPVDARIRTPDNIRRDAVPVREFVEAIQNTNSRVALLILDACRDYPFGKGGNKGLSRGDEAENVLVAYATAEGRTAAEGDGRYSPYAKALAQHLKRTDITLLHALDEVADAVRTETANAQAPTRSGNLRHNACLLEGRCMVYAPTPAQLANATRTAEEDDEHWKRLGSSSEAWQFLAYQVKFPNGRNVEAARKRSGFVSLSRSGCAMRESAPLSQDVEMDWTGRCVDGLADGPGTKTFWRGGVKTTEWQGGYARGIPAGTWVGAFPAAVQPGDRKEVTLTFDRSGELSKVQKYVTNAGTTYLGETNATTQSPSSGRPHGRGHMKLFDGGDYEGEFVDGAYEGRGTLTPPASASATSFVKYAGDFFKGRPNGQGTMWYADGGSYVGQWVNGVREGKGKYTGAKGDSMDGDWLAGKPVRATVVYPPSDNPDAYARYVGMFKDGSFSGMGRMTLVSGAIYEGEWLHGRRHGRGELTVLPRGPESMVRYAGEFQDNVPEGQGVMEWANRARYVGAVSTGRPHGQGEMRRPDGSIRRGIFDKSRPPSEDPR
ncbi:MAG: hypothetical protein JWQ07_4084 [Ramlibacter sp.]|nr:hypothetical protein [Ramlibacter sp.]